MQNVLITGGSGLIGKRLTEILLQKDYSVAWLTRSAGNVRNNNVRLFAWNIEENTIDEESIRWADAIIHLAGAGIADKRWTAARKKEIIGSRVQSAELLYRSLEKIPHHVRTFISSSAIGYYGNRNDEVLHEESGPGKDFLSEACIAWEDAVMKIPQGIRRVIFRTGIVLAKEAGAYHEMTKTARFGILPVMGNGKQIYSWIHSEDICQLYLHALENNALNGIYNAVATDPVSQKAMMREIAKYKTALRMPVPAFLLRLLLGEMASTVLISQHVSNEKIRMAGYKFTFVEIKDAVQNLSEK